MTLLKTEPVSYDRIEAYLNILNQQNTQNTQNRRALNKNKKKEDVQFNEVNYNILVKNIGFLSKMMTDNKDKISILEKIANY
mgnify:FL=1|jgi:hypothetical protein